jgi:hypothetical protein
LPYGKIKICVSGVVFEMSENISVNWPSYLVYNSGVSGVVKRRLERVLFKEAVM